MNFKLFGDFIGLKLKSEKNKRLQNVEFSLANRKFKKFVYCRKSRERSFLEVTEVTSKVNYNGGESYVCSRWW